jgi:hypothetical protein
LAKILLKAYPLNECEAKKRFGQVY